MHHIPQDSQQIISLRLVDYCMQVGLRFGDGSFAFDAMRLYMYNSHSRHNNYLFVIGLVAFSLA